MALVVALFTGDVLQFFLSLLFQCNKLTPHFHGVCTQWLCSHVCKIHTKYKVHVGSDATFQCFYTVML